MPLRRLSENTVSAIIGAVAFATLSAGTAVAVSTTAVSITNPSTGKRAHVTGQESLVVSERDPYTGTYGRVDADGRQLVTSRDGAPKTPYSVTVSGSMNAGQYSTSGSKAAPSSTFVIETITGMVGVEPGGSRPMLTLRTTPRSGQMAEVQLPVEWMVTEAEGFEQYVFTLEARAYTIPGSSLIAIATRSGTVGNAFYNVTAIGHLA